MIATAHENLRDQNHWPCDPASRTKTTRGGKPLRKSNPRTYDVRTGTRRYARFGTSTNQLFLSGLRETTEIPKPGRPLPRRRGTSYAISKPQKRLGPAKKSPPQSVRASLPEGWVAG